jgi:hypothetical protein
MEFEEHPWLLEMLPVPKDPERCGYARELKEDECASPACRRFEAPLRCARCLTASYCGAPCQRADWARHRRKGRCVPIEVRVADLRSRIAAAQLGGGAVDGEAHFALARLHMRGLGVAHSAREAVGHARIAADAGVPSACHLLGIHYLRGSGVARDLAEAARWFRRGADANDPESVSELGGCYYLGKGVTVDLLKATQHFARGTELGSISAAERLATFYADGLGGLSRDPLRASRLWRTAADRGHSEAANKLGFCFWTGGKGTPKDWTEAARLYKLSSDLGNANGIFNLAITVLNGQGVEKDQTEALRLLKLAADVGQPMAAACWGEILLRGRYGLPVDRPEAERLLRLACDEQPNARVVLGFELIGGPEAERRSPEVEKEGTGLLFDAVGEEGELGGRAAFALGLAYFLGRGVPRDVNEARRWHKRSVEIGGGGPWYADTTGERWQADLEQAEAEAQAAEEAAENAKSATETTQPEKVD